MNTRNLFTLVALINLLFGPGLIFAVESMANLYLTDPGWVNPGATLLAQGWGIMLLAEGAACLVLRNEGLSTGSRALLVLLAVSNAGWLVLHTLAILNKVETPMAWLQVAMGIVVGGWAALLLRQPARRVA